MTIRSDSFSSTAEVRGFTRHLLDGHLTFDDSTRPTLTEVEKFIDRASALLNVALSAEGLTPSDVYGNAVAKLACDDWVTQQAVKYVIFTQRNTGIFSDTPEMFTMDNARDWVKETKLGFVNMGIALDTSSSRGLSFTGLSAQSERSDQDDSTREQPLFTRRMFENT
jgi:hypothetical protein